MILIFDVPRVRGRFESALADFTSSNLVLALIANFPRRIMSEDGCSCVPLVSQSAGAAALNLVVSDVFKKKKKKENLFF